MSVAICKLEKQIQQTIGKEGKLEVSRGTIRLQRRLPAAGTLGGARAVRPCLMPVATGKPARCPWALAARVGTALMLPQFPSVSLSLSNTEYLFAELHAVVSVAGAAIVLIAEKNTFITERFGDRR
jgi:hypothetical protein